MIALKYLQFGLFIILKLIKIVTIIQLIANLIK